MSDPYVKPHTSAIEGATALEDGSTLMKGLANDVTHGGIGFDVNTSLAAVSLLGAAIDPLGGVIGCAVGWAFEHISFLREPVDKLTGDPGAITAAAQTWANIAVALPESASRYEDALRSLGTDQWAGAGRDRYQQNATEAIETLQASSKVASGASLQLTAAAVACGTLRGQIIDAISTFATWMAYKGIAAAASAIVTVGGSLSAWVLDLQIEGMRLGAKIEGEISKFMGEITKLVRKISGESAVVRQAERSMSKSVAAQANHARTAVKTTRNALNDLTKPAGTAAREAIGNTSIVLSRGHDIQKAIETGNKFKGITNVEHALKSLQFTQDLANYWLHPDDPHARNKVITDGGESLGEYDAKRTKEAVQSGTKRAVKHVRDSSKERQHRH